MPSVGRVVAYVVCGIPAAVGTAYVARHGYATSDTPDSAIGTAFLFGMIAAGAYVCPVLSAALANRGRIGTAVAFAILALAALIGNWSNTLDALTLRNAGTEAEAGKAVAQEKDRRAELKRIEGERGRMSFTPATAAEVNAAEGAVSAAERSKAAECGKRGPFCRQRETDEASARETLRSTLANKAASDLAATLDQRAADLRRKLDTSKAAPEGNRTLADTIARMLSLSAATAATVQQGYVSALVEMLIAAALAFPELLRSAPDHRGRQQGIEPEAADAPATETPPAAPSEFGSVRRFMLACIRRSNGEKVTRGAIYKRYLRWCDEQEPRAAPLPIPTFWEQFAPLCDTVAIEMSERSGKVFCVDIQLAA